RQQRRPVHPVGQAPGAIRPALRVRSEFCARVRAGVAGSPVTGRSGPREPRPDTGDCSPMDRVFTRIATWVAKLAGKPAAFLLAISIVVVWGFTGPVFGFSDTWQLVINTGTTIVTFLMVFLIQNSQNRDAAAMQAKLDEILRATEGARRQFIGIE